MKPYIELGVAAQVNVKAVSIGFKCMRAAAGVDPAAHAQLMRICPSSVARFGPQES